MAKRRAEEHATMHGVDSMPNAVDLSAMRRIMVMGPSGSGKSTLARLLGERLGLPVVHLDRLFWMPGWVQRSEDDFQMAVRKAAEGERWIIDGNYRRTIEPRLARADAIIFLDMPRHVYVLRVIVRQLRTYGRVRTDMGEGCPEQFDVRFLKWVWDHEEKRRPEMVQQMIEHQEQLPVIWLNNRRAVRSLLRSANRA
jgi:adenylate kinase family enzyme